MDLDLGKPQRTGTVLGPGEVTVQFTTIVGYITERGNPQVGCSGTVLTIPGFTILKNHPHTHTHTYKKKLPCNEIKRRWLDPRAHNARACPIHLSQVLFILFFEWMDEKKGSDSGQIWAEPRSRARRRIFFFGAGVHSFP